MSVLAPTVSAERFEPVGDWHPTRCTPTLTGDPEKFHTVGDKLLATALAVWTIDGEPLDLDPWQIWLLRRLLEVYPPDWPVEHLRGKLRYKQFVVSMGRQNGKSVVGGLLVFFWLTMHYRVPKIGGFASIEEQAGIIYSRVYQAIDANETLRASLRHTKTKGIWHKPDPARGRSGAGLYKTFPAKEDSLQGEPFTAALYDELHLGNMGLWDAIKLGQRSKLAAQIGGFTTAGDDESLLLKRLYDEGDKAIGAAEEVIAAAQACLDTAGTIVADEYDKLTAGAERFGFFVWEGADDELTEANVIAANPAVACGRIPLTEVMADARATWLAGPDENGITGRDRVIRYTLNRFVDGVADAWLSNRLLDQATGPVAPREPDHRCVYSFDRAEDWTAAAIFETRPIDGQLQTRLIASIIDPTPADLVEAARGLHALGAATFAVCSDTLKEVGAELKTLGFETWVLGVTEEAEACARTVAHIAQGRVVIERDPLTRHQSKRAKRASTSTGWRISKKSSESSVDAVRAMIAGIYVADRLPDNDLDLF